VTADETARRGHAPRAPLTGAQRRAVEAAVRRYGAFLGLTATTTSEGGGRVRAPY